MKRFINRENELSALNKQYAADNASLMIIYGRRRIGKTTLIKEFIKDKKTLYFLADDESEVNSMKRFAGSLAEYTGLDYINKIVFDDWRELFKVFLDYKSDAKKILVIDELPYMVNANTAFPSILQWVWDEWFQNQNIMVILCGSLISMMEKYTLNYSSPLYGRRTGQIKMKQIDFMHYNMFYNDMPYRSLIEHYAVTGGVPKYIELLSGYGDIFDEIEQNILSTNGLLYEEPELLLRREVDDISSYFVIIKSIAEGNHRQSKISDATGIRQTSLSKYLKILIDLDILEREVPITENNPEKCKTSLYQIKDNFLRFWFRFVYPERARIELGQSDYVLERIKSHFVDNHVAHIYETVCRSELWKLNLDEKLQFNKLGRWWNSNEEIDIVAYNSQGEEIIFAECKYRSKPMDTDVFYDLLRKKDFVPWRNDTRKETFVLFSINGFTGSLNNLAGKRNDLLLIDGNGKLCAGVKEGNMK